MSLFLGIDMGTSACRIAAIDTDEQLKALVRVALPEPIQEGNQCEQAPDIWWHACTEALDTILTQIPASEVDAIAVDGTSSTLMLCDELGIPQGNALMYRDQRASSQARQLDSIVPASAAVHSPSSSLAKLLWFKDQGMLNRELKALHQADWITGQLTEVFDISDENNALKLGYDPLSRDWPDWIDICQLPDGCLPKVLPAGAPISKISTEIADHFGFREDCMVCAGTTDSTASFIATGATEPGDAVTILGSTLVVKILSEAPINAPEYGIYSHRLGEQWLVGGASNAGGAMLNRYFSDQQLIDISAEITPDKASPLDYYPLPCRGERFPDNNPELEPRLSPRPDNDVEFLHGLLESLARIEQRGYQRLVELGALPPRSVRTCGGGAQNSTWAAIRQRRLGVPLEQVRHTEAAVGAAMLAKKNIQ